MIEFVWVDGAGGKDRARVSVGMAPEAYLEVEDGDVRNNVALTEQQLDAVILQLQAARLILKARKD